MTGKRGFRAVSRGLGLWMGALFLSSACGMPVAFADQVLSWQDCLREAARNHPDLIAAQEGVVQQEASRALAGSSRWPQVNADLNASSSRSDSSGSGNAFSYGASASQLIFDGFKTGNDIKAAVENVNAAKAGFRFTSVGVRFRLRQAFVNLLKAQELQSLTSEIYKIRKSNLDLITLRYQSGMEHKGAWLTAQANVSQALFEVDRAGRGLEEAQVALIKELGYTQFSPVHVKGRFDITVVDLQKPDLQLIAENDPSLQKIAAQKRSAEFSLKADHGDFWPEVSLTGGISKSDTRWMPENQGTSAGIKVSLPLFEGGSRSASLARAKSVYRQLEQQERSLKDGIVLGLEQSWNGFQDAVGNVAVQQDFLSATQERSKIAEQQYKVGLISFNDWTIIEDSLVSSKKLFLDIQANALLAEAGWIQAKGEMLEYEK